MGTGGAHPLVSSDDVMCGAPVCWRATQGLSRDLSVSTPFPGHRRHPTIAGVLRIHPRRHRLHGTVAAVLAAVLFGAAPVRTEDKETLEGPGESREASRFAAQGTGTPEDPWVGWEGALAPNTRTFFRRGNYQLRSSLVIPAGATLEGEGAASTIQFAMANIGLLNDSNAGDITLRNLRIAGTAGRLGASTVSSIQFLAGTGQTFVLENLTLEDAGQDGILIVGTQGRVTDVTVSGCRLAGANRHGIELRTVTNGVIRANTVRATNRKTIGASIYAGSDVSTTGIVVAENIVESSGDNGIRSAGSHVVIQANQVADVSTDGIRLAGRAQSCTGNVVRRAAERGVKVEDGSHVSVVGNVVTSCAGDGLEVRFTRSQPSDVTISGNVSSANGGNGVVVYGGEGVVITGNQISENGQAGIKLYADGSRTVARVTIASNQIYRNGASVAEGSPPVHDGITVDGKGLIGSVLIASNVVDGASRQRYGINVTRGSSVRVENNLVSANVAASLKTGDGKVHLIHRDRGAPVIHAEDGSIYLREDGGPDSPAFYVREQGIWVPQP